MARPLRRNRFPLGDAASLVLRLSLAITLADLSLSNDTASAAMSVSAAAAGCLIASGLFTRLAAASGFVLIAACDRTGLIALVPVAAGGLSLALVGAGAYSIDELLFRRRFSDWPDRMTWRR